MVGFSVFAVSMPLVIAGCITATHIADLAEVGGSYGGYSEDHEFFGYRQSI